MRWNDQKNTVFDEKILFAKPSITSAHDLPRPHTWGGYSPHTRRLMLIVRTPHFGSRKLVNVENPCGIFIGI